MNQTIIIFGNSGAGKSTLAGKLSREHQLAHLDLDTLAWAPGSPPRRRDLVESATQIHQFTRQHANWVVEGCYADLLALVSPYASEMIFLNPGVDACIRNCRQRPWEPHKYSSPEAQNNNLNMLIDWVKQYALRDDEFSLRAHRLLFDTFTGPKREITAM